MFSKNELHFQSALTIVKHITRKLNSLALLECMEFYVTKKKNQK